MAKGKLLNVDMGVGGIETRMRPRELGDDLHAESMILSMGPSHPAMHGTVRIVVELSGEKIIDADVEIGYLHRGFEKSTENVDYNQVMPYTDRLNYVSPFINNHGWCLTIEKLLGIEVPKRCSYIRVLMSEISRICDHLTCLGASAMELAALTPMLYLIEARELLYRVHEKVTGARLTLSYGRVGGLAADLPPGFAEEARPIFKKIRSYVADCEKLLNRNRIFMDRMCDIGIISQEMAADWALSGPMGRASGLNYDVRKAFPYSCYDEFDFEIPLGTKGDNYDRFNVRLQEIEQSLRICEQALERMPGGPFRVDDPRIIQPPKDRVYGSIEGMINQFEMVMYGVKPPPGEVYLSVEGGNGELGFYVVSDGSGHAYRGHCRAPCFLNMGALRESLIGINLADIIPTFDMVNYIAGECER